MTLLRSGLLCAGVGVLSGCSVLASLPGGSPTPAAMPACYAEPMRGAGGSWINQRSVRVPVGYIVLVRERSAAEGMGAFRPEEQEPEGRGQFTAPFVRYTWWYQSSADSTFRSATTRFGAGDSQETRGGQGPTMLVGSLPLTWSSAGPGLANYYFGPPHSRDSDTYAYGLTCEVDLHRIDPDLVVWVGRPGVVVY